MMARGAGLSDRARRAGGTPCHARHQAHTRAERQRADEVRALRGAVRVGGARRHRVEADATAGEAAGRDALLGAHGTRAVAHGAALARRRPAAGRTAAAHRRGRDAPTRAADARAAAPEAAAWPVVHGATARAPRGAGGIADLPPEALAGGARRTALPEARRARGPARDDGVATGGGERDGGRRREEGQQEVSRGGATARGSGIGGHARGGFHVSCRTAGSAIDELVGCDVCQGEQGPRAPPSERRPRVPSPGMKVETAAPLPLISGTARELVLAATPVFLHTFAGTAVMGGRCP